MAPITDQHRTPLGEISLAWASNVIERDSGLEDGVRTRWLGSLRRLAGYLDRAPENVPMAPKTLLHGIRDLDPVALGISRKSLQNLSSDLRAIWRHLKLLDFPATHRQVLDGEWASLWEELDEKRARKILGRFIRYCAAKGIVPADVDDAVLIQFLEDAAKGGFLKKPGDQHRQIARAWSKAAAGINGWPDTPIAVPDHRHQTKNLPWDAFPASLVEDVEAYLACLGGKDFLRNDTDHKPCKPSTVITRRRYLRSTAAAAVRAGVDISSLRSLEDLLKPDVVLRALEQLLNERADGKPSTFIIGLASILLSIAVRWVKAPVHEIEELCRYAKKLGSFKKKGLTPKNEAVIRRLREPSMKARLLSLPEELMERALRKTNTPYKAAVEAQIAVAIGLLIAAPMRISNLVALDLDTDVLRRADGTYHIAIPDDQVKNDVALEYPLPARISDLLAVYLKQFRAHLKGAHGHHLFPGATGGHKTQSPLRDQIEKTIKREMGFKITPHQFRHAAAAWILDADPGNYELVRRVLSHKNITTTIEFYVGLEQPQAITHYQNTMLGYGDNSEEARP
jgi:integrase